MTRLINASIVGLLSLPMVACLVSDNDTPARQRTTDYLRVYQSGDRLEYNISGTSYTNTGSSTLTGSLRISYASHVSLPIPPPRTESVAVIKESTVLSTNLAGTQGVTRYISQNIVDGTLTLHAFEGPTQEIPYYWVTGDSQTSTSAPTPVVIVDSPYVVSAPIENRTYSYSVSDCESSGTCSETFEFLSETQRIADTEDVVTNAGKFNAFRVEIDNATLTKYGSAAPFINVDFRHFCNAIGSATVGAANFYGTMWVVPEVGVVKYQIYCTNPNATNGSTFLLNASLSDTNITLPN